MQVFISWSGEQTKTLGHELKEFIETSFAGHVHPFLSDANIAPGERFLDVINDSLDASVIGILLLTRSNMSEPWILFEAGALAGKTSSGSVIPLLVDLDRAELRPPLSQFNNVYGGVEADIRKLCARINTEVGPKLNQVSFELLFAQAWPRLQSAILDARSASTAETAVSPQRQTDDMLNEILLGVNALVRIAAPSATPTWPDIPKTTTFRDNSRLILNRGDRLSHPDFGEGSVTTITGEGNKRIAHVKFDTAGAKKLLVKVAPIEVISSGEGSSSN